MDVELVIERARRVAAARHPDTNDLATVRAALTAVSELRSWLSASEAALASKLRDEVSFPEKDLADCTRGSLGDAAKATERADTLAALPGFADALDQAAVTPGHIDEITRKSKGLSDPMRNVASGSSALPNSSTSRRSRRRESSRSGSTSSAARSSAATASPSSPGNVRRPSSVTGPTARACTATPGAPTR